MSQKLNSDGITLLMTALNLAIQCKRYHTAEKLAITIAGICKDINSNKSKIENIQTFNNSPYDPSKEQD